MLAKVDPPRLILTLIPDNSLQHISPETARRIDQHSNTGNSSEHRLALVCPHSIAGDLIATPLADFISSNCP
jgi:hypothetical protein